MTLTLILVGLLGVALLGWHHTHERCRRLERGNAFLAAELVAAIEQNQDPRRTPSAKYWGSDVLDRLWEDIQRQPPLYDSHLHLVDDPSEAS